MQISTFDKLRSYIMDVKLESTSSDYNEVLDLYISKGRYQLCSENAIYSFDDLYDNYYRAFRQLPLQSLDIEEVLILGLGLGSIVSMAEQKFGKKWRYTAVEIDPEVIRMAQKYALSNLSSPVQVYNTDALLFMEQNQRTFDLICLDIFVDDIIPKKFQTVKFLSWIKDALGENGLLLYNRLARTKKDKEGTREFFDGPFKTVFPEATYLDVKGNWMLMNHQPSSP
jgi:spermidine synthase